MLYGRAGILESPFTPECVLYGRVGRNSAALGACVVYRRGSVRLSGDRVDWAIYGRVGMRGSVTRDGWLLYGRTGIRESCKVLEDLDGVAAVAAAAAWRNCSR